MVSSFIACTKRVYPGWKNYYPALDIGAKTGLLGCHIACVFGSFGIDDSGKIVEPDVAALRAVWQEIAGRFYSSEIKKEGKKTRPRGRGRSILGSRA
jgi:hypothetical protein